MNYPNQLDDKNSLFEVKDLGRTSTSKPLDAVELEIEIDNPINFPTGRHIVVVESEVIIISHKIDNILYVEKRGAFDTLSENHIANSKIGVVFTSAHYETLRDSIIDIQKEIWTYRKPVNDVLDDPQTIIPVENESYLVGLSPLNEFIGKENNIATWNGTSWDFISPQPAFEMYILNKGKYEFNGTSWILNKDVEISNVNDLQNQLNNRYIKSENDNLLNTKVDKETGKSLVKDTKVSDYDSHLVNIANPHNVTALQVGAYSKSENDNLLDKKANLDINNKIPLSEIPDSILGQLKYMGVWDFSSGFPTGAQKGNYWITSVSGNGYEVGDWAVYNGTIFDKVDNTDAVSSVAGRTGNVVLNKNDVGLNNVDNTSDLNKPISTATQTALDTTVKLTGNETIAGVKTFSSSIVGDITGNSATTTKLKTPVKINGINFDGSVDITIEAGGSGVELRSTNITVDVGSGQTYTTINQALEYLSGFYPMYKKSRVTATINLKAGFVMAEQVFVSGIDLGWITIVGEDAETIITKPALTIAFNGGTPTFGVDKGGTSPVVGQLFRYNIEKVGVVKHGLMAFGAGSSAEVLNGKGFIGAGANGLYAVNGSTINAQGANCSNSGIVGISAVNGSTINAQGANCSNAGQYGILSSSASTVNANGANCSNSGVIGVYSQHGSTINAQGAIIQNQTTGGARVTVQDGSTINAVAIDTTGGTIPVFSQSVNTLTGQGIIYG